MGAACSAGLDGLTRALALDLAPLRVNVVHPGATETELWGTLGVADRQKSREVFERTSLSGRAAGPEDVAEAFGYLMRDWNVTGASVHSSSGFCCSERRAYPCRLLMWDTWGSTEHVHYVMLLFCASTLAS
jgi:NAD(P)-dependent dehydrogenase (short-subunit alcohol dehydrogenase family)